MKPTKRDYRAIDRALGDNWVPIDTYHNLAQAIANERARCARVVLKVGDYDMGGGTWVASKQFADAIIASGGGKP